MTPDSETAHEDLAFLKALVSEGPKAQVIAGRLFVVAGTVYGLQALAYAAQIVFALQWSPALNLFIGFAPLAVLVAYIAWLTWQGRKGNTSQGVATRALSAGFQGAGLANLALCIVFGYVAMTQKNFMIWMLYPAVTAGVQGACWYIAYMIRRRLWLAGVCAGWFATAIALGFLIRNPAAYLFLLGIALFVLLVAPGYVMAREGDTSHIGGRDEQ